METQVRDILSPSKRWVKIMKHLTNCIKEFGKAKVREQNLQLEQVEKELAQVLLQGIHRVQAIKIMLHKILPLPNELATTLNERMEEEISMEEIEEAMRKMEAYDTLEWDYILTILKCNGFSWLSLRWIRAILKMTNFTIAFNGKLTAIIYASSSINQGCPF
eukprot:Gb_34453 [translate_table: standard]